MATVTQTIYFNVDYEQTSTTIDVELYSRHTIRWLLENSGITSYPNFKYATYRGYHYGSIDDQIAIQRNATLDVYTGVTAYHLITMNLYKDNAFYKTSYYGFGRNTYYETFSDFLSNSGTGEPPNSEFEKAIIGSTVYTNYYTRPYLSNDATIDYYFVHQTVELEVHVYKDETEVSSGTCDAPKSEYISFRNILSLAGLQQPSSTRLDDVYIDGDEFYAESLDDTEEYRYDSRLDYYFITSGGSITAYIFTNGEWVQSTPYIFTEGSWQQVTPSLFNGGWK